MLERDSNGFLIRRITSRCKVTTAEVIKIRELYADGRLNQAELAVKFQVDVSTISRITSGKSWNSAGGPITKRRSY